jgi:hypothetical protein
MKWLFKYENFNGDAFYLDADGNETDKPIAWHGDRLSAQIERSKRSSIWEQKKNSFITLENIEQIG